MDELDNSAQNRILDFVRSNILFVLLLCGGIIFLGIGLVQIMGRETTEVSFEKGTDISFEKEAGFEIKVDVDGAVVHPGLYVLKPDARVQDALIAAGGLTQEANRKAVNLAAKITDGQKIYIPKIGEAAVVQASVAGVESNSGVISINNSSMSDLDKLPGVGAVTAQKIIDNRPYGSVQELLEKKVVGQATFEKIRDSVSL